MAQSATVYPLPAVRAPALHTQGLGEPLRRSGRPTADDVYGAIERIGWVQIDTLQVVRRAQYLTLWSRLGSCDLDRLLFECGAARASFRLPTIGWRCRRCTATPIPWSPSGCWRWRRALMPGSAPLTIYRCTVLAAC